jgi:hypothetical protein
MTLSLQDALNVLGTVYCEAHPVPMGLRSGVFEASVPQER